MRRLFSLSVALSILSVMLCVTLLGSAVSAKASSASMPVVFVTAVQPNITLAADSALQIETRGVSSDKFASYVSAIEEAGDDVSLPTRSLPVLRTIKSIAWDVTSHTFPFRKNTSALYRPPLI